MATSFEAIYKRFLRKLDDPTFAEMTDEDVLDLMNGFLMTSIAKVRELKVGGFDLNSSETAFSYNLSNLEQEILAMGMLQEWLETQVESISLTKQFIATKEENFFAQHNHLHGIEALYDRVKKEKKQLISRYKTLHNSYLDTEEEPDDTTVIPIPDDSSSDSSDVTPIVVGTTDYNDLENKPSINDVTLQGNLLITALLNENTTTGETDIDVMINDAFGDDGS